MADVLNRTTKIFLQSVNTPDYKKTEWIINPDMSQVKNLDPKYLIIQGDTVRDATTQEAVLIDAQTPPPEKTEIQLIQEDIKNIWDEIELLKRG